MNVLVEKIKVSSCRTYHVLQEKPLYKKRFAQVEKFHSPGIAPVQDEEGAYHIDLQGRACYSKRFFKTYGFYDEVAAVSDQTGWYHIFANGEPCYPNRYTWVGNFQEQLCVVNEHGKYFHIGVNGKPLYLERYHYVGDFKDGYAVTARSVNAHMEYAHIDMQGNSLYSQIFLYTDPFHKNFARALDKHGWFHINRSGQALYNERYAFVEPFYNELAYVRTQQGNCYRINPHGQIVETLYEASPPSARGNTSIEQLSNQMISFWQIHVLYAGKNVDIFNQLPGNTVQIAERCSLSLNHCQRLLRGLWEMGVVYKTQAGWYLTSTGQYLATPHSPFMACAIEMWYRVNAEWLQLPEQIKRAEDRYHPCFKEQADLAHLKSYHHALDGYTRHDFNELPNLIDWTSCHCIFATGACGRIILPDVLSLNSHMQGFLHDSSTLLRDYKVPTHLSNRLKTLSFNLQKSWKLPKNSLDALLFARYFHYWPDQPVAVILKNAKEVLAKNGKIYIAETLLDENKPDGGFLDLNMLVETGGRLRTFEEWQALSSNARLFIHETIKLKPYLTLLILQRTEERI